MKLELTPIGLIHSPHRQAEGTPIQPRWACATWRNSTVSGCSTGSTGRERRSFGAVGLWARVIQHELDHLKGVLICDDKHPETEQCLHCPLELLAELVEEHKHQSRPNRRR